MPSMLPTVALPATNGAIVSPCSVNSSVPTRPARLRTVLPTALPAIIFSRPVTPEIAPVTAPTPCAGTARRGARICTAWACVMPSPMSCWYFASFAQISGGSARKVSAVWLAASPALDSALTAPRVRVPAPRTPRPMVGARDPAPRATTSIPAAG